MMYLYIGIGLVAFSLVGYFVSMPIVSNWCYKKFFSRSTKRRELTDAHYEPFKADIYAARERMEKLPFTEHYITAADGVKLYARHYDYGKDKTVVFLHGAHSQPLNNFAVTAERFIEWGYNVFMPDQRAHGRSGGDYLTYGDRESGDLIEWIKYITDNFPAKLVLYGISMGAATIGMASDRLPKEVRSAVCDCGFTSVGDLIKLIAKRSRAPLTMFGILERRCRRELKLELTASTTEHLKNASVPTFFIHGTADEAVPYEHSQLNYETCAAQKELLLVDGCGHTTAALKGDAPQKIHDFINKYI